MDSCGATELVPNVRGSNTSKRCEAQLNACHPALVRLLHKVQERVDIKVSAGHLDKIDQGQRCSEGNSRLARFQTRLRSDPSMAVNMVPCCEGTPSYGDAAFLLFACVVFECAAEIGVRVRWGGNRQTLRNMQRWELMLDHD